MPICGQGWELHIVRDVEQSLCERVRTIGRYKVFRDGVPVAGLSGVTAEPGGPGQNDESNCGLRIAAGNYSLSTHHGDAYCSIGYVVNADHRLLRKPALKLGRTGLRTDILVHPGHGFLASEGCINPADGLPNNESLIDFEASRDRVIALLRDLKHYAAKAYPEINGQDIPSARVIIDEPASLSSPSAANTAEQEAERLSWRRGHDD